MSPWAWVASVISATLIVDIVATICAYNAGRNKQRQVMFELSKKTAEMARTEQKDALSQTPKCQCSHIWNVHNKVGGRCHFWGCICQFYYGEDPTAAGLYSVSKAKPAAPEVKPGI